MSIRKNIDFYGNMAETSDKEDRRGDSNTLSGLMDSRFCGNDKGGL